MWCLYIWCGKCFSIFTKVNSSAALCRICTTLAQLTSDGEVITDMQNPYWNVPPMPVTKMAAITRGHSSCRNKARKQFEWQFFYIWWQIIKLYFPFNTFPKASICLRLCWIIYDASASCSRLSEHLIKCSIKDDFHLIKLAPDLHPKWKKNVR